VWKNVVCHRFATLIFGKFSSYEKQHRFDRLFAYIINKDIIKRQETTTWKVLLAAFFSEGFNMTIYMAILNKNRGGVFDIFL
jgi:hypothetical protein